jgi:hypothetical protein
MGLQDDFCLLLFEKVGMILISASSPAVARIFPFFENEDEVIC